MNKNINKHVTFSQEVQYLSTFSSQVKHTCIGRTKRKKRPYFTNLPKGNLNNMGEGNLLAPLVAELYVIVIFRNMTEVIQNIWRIKRGK